LFQRLMETLESADLHMLNRLVSQLTVDAQRLKDRVIPCTSYYCCKAVLLCLLPNDSVVLNCTFSFLANVNSRSRLLCAVARLSVVCLSVCNAHAPYSAGCNFPQYFYGIWYLGHPLISTENFTEIVPGEPLRRGS